MLVVVLVRISINTNAFDDHVQTYMKHTVDFLLKNTQISSSICHHLYSNLLIKLDQLRRFVSQQSSLASRSPFLTSIDFHQLHIHDVLQQKDYSMIRLHLLQTLFQFKLILLQSSGLQLDCIHDDRYSLLLLYANLAYATLPNDRPLAETDLTRLNESVDSFLNNVTNSELRQYSQQCDQIYPLNTTVTNIARLQWQYRSNELLASQLKKVTSFLDNLCGKVCWSSCPRTLLNSSILVLHGSATLQRHKSPKVASLSSIVDVCER